MTLYQLVSQLKLTDSEVEIFAECLTKGYSLKKLSQALDQKISEKQAFALARLYCPEALGDDLDTIAPNLIEDRNRLLGKEKESLKAERDHKETLKVLKLIEEDLSFLILEISGKMPASE